DTVRLLVRFVPGHLEQIGEQSLRQGVPPHDVLGFSATLGREQDLLARAMLDQPVALHALQGDRHGWRRNVEPRGQSRGDYRVTVTGQVVQDLQVVFDNR